ncbi:ABC transporter ATP-binding protein [Jannaschia sp. M317]|uniref:ABC transporter ATP-binding protein n=1 Tax=Jannaschia sp. M317 TaxID=2867011 RepID=UPI0021A90C0B|nr:ABC transporter ATP-binding protein [Jannaschia sp. M317]UWQ17896.1 ABC transporter ATP-binding protein [Jannaschia sp. M317]
MLSIKDLGMNFSGFQALNGIHLDLEEGEKHAILGPNGAGKTTFFNSITGQLMPTAGKVHYKGELITGKSPSRIVKMGIARSFQRINIYPKLSVFENVQVALIADKNLMFNLWSPGATLFREETARMLDLVRLTEEADTTAGLMSYGKQKQLELAIALSSEPDLLLLDEPTAGMSPQETLESIKLIGDIASRRKLTLLFTEHDMQVVFAIADRMSVLHHGELIATGSPEEVRNNAEVRRIYLGGHADDAA